MNATLMIPGLWSVAGNLGTVSAIGTVRQVGATFSFVPQPAGSNAERELADAGYRGKRLDGFASVEDAAKAGASLCAP